MPEEISDNESNELSEEGATHCPFCGGELDALGHLCPRSNGYKR